MPTISHKPHQRDHAPAIDYAAAEGLTDAPPVELAMGAGSPTAGGRERSWREWTLVGVGLTTLLALLSAVLAAYAVVSDDGSSASTRPSAAPAAARAAPVAAADKPAPTLADAKGVAFEPFERIDPRLPAVPAGAVKRFKVDVFQHGEPGGDADMAKMAAKKPDANADRVVLVLVAVAVERDDDVVLLLGDPPSTRARAYGVPST